MTTVAVEKRKFKIREMRCRLLLITIVIFVFIGTITTLIVWFCFNADGGFEIKQRLAIYETVATTVFFVITTFLFFFEARRNQHAMF